jgi:hypothetical protein
MCDACISAVVYVVVHFANYMLSAYCNGAWAAAQAA